ncbi:MAG: hypothetical protein VX640_09085 [Pseudomonadota bacterium]|nr:hypothetical protein [Pseudomonadota bacterium]
MRARVAASVIALSILAACGGEDRSEVSTPAAPEAGSPEATPETEETVAIDQIAEGFVKLALGAGQHDPNFVDAYDGPPEWQAAAIADKRSLEDLEADAQRLLTDLEKLGEPDARALMLQKLLTAALTRIRMTQGRTFPFDEETRLLYDAVAPAYDLKTFDAALAEIDKLLPGEGPLNERVDAFRNSLAIPKDRMLDVFNAAIAECRRRTVAHFDLPLNESFTLEFVTDKPWSGYNWYQGDYESLIQVNTDLPIVIDRAVDLGCHEGYPGHHTWHSLIDRELVKGNGWVEYSVYPLFSPASVIAEGSGNYGIELAFPGDEKIAFERDVLFPLAGLDPEKAATLDALNKLRRKLSHADNHAAREYLEGRMSKDEAVESLMKYTLASRERAEQRVRFIATYRGYVINYNVGRDLVAGFVERAEAAGENPWDAFGSLLMTPRPASALTARE